MKLNNSLAILIQLFLLIGSLKRHSGESLPDFNEKKMPFAPVEEQLRNQSWQLRFSLLTGYRPNIKPIFNMGVNFNSYDDAVTRIRRIYMYNLSMQDMLTHGTLPAGDIILEVKDPSRYRFISSLGDKLSWTQKNAYCFELSLPIGMTTLEILDREIERVIGVKVIKEKRRMNTLILVRTSKDEKYRGDGGKFIMDGKNDTTGEFTNLYLADLVTYLTWRSPMRVLDETGIDRMLKITVELNVKDWSDIPALRKALQRYDLDLQEEIREREAFVIHEIDYKQ